MGRKGADTDSESVLPNLGCYFHRVHAIRVAVRDSHECEKKEEEVHEVKEEQPLLRHRSSKAPSPKEEVHDDSLKGVKDDADLTLSQAYHLYFDILKSPYVV